jgi:YfiH family protein
LIEQEHGNLAYLQFAQLHPYDTIIHGIFTRQGGYSEGVYHGLNTSALSGKDNYVTVARNRSLALDTLHIAPSRCVTLWQVHGVDVKILDTASEWRTDWGNRSYWEQPWLPHMIHKGDAVITRERGVALALSFADCTPIVFYDPIQQAIGIAHGGWRGTAHGIVAATVEAMQHHFASKPEELLAHIGPTIGPCCYEVSAMVQDIFQGKLAFEDEPALEHYSKLVRESAVFSIRQLADRQSLRLDLQTTNRNQLLMSGVRPEHIECADICTSCNTHRFFSHRGEQGQTGRFPVIIMLKET